MIWLSLLLQVAFAAEAMTKQDERDLQNEHRQMILMITQQQRDAERYVKDIKEQSDRHASQLLTAQEKIFPALDKVGDELQKLNNNLTQLRQQQEDPALKILQILFYSTGAGGLSLWGMRQTKAGRYLGDRRQARE